MGPVNVLFSVDVECSIGGAFSDAGLKPVGNDRRIFGRFGGRTYGIPRLMDVAERFGFRLSFFVECCSACYFGIDATREVCFAILERGHDVQLHLHPEFLWLKEERGAGQNPPCGLAYLPEDRQLEIIQEGIATLKSCGVPSVKAFRAGGYGAGAATLRALSRAGIWIDTSYNASFLKDPSRFGLPGPINDVTRCGSIWEFPVTHFACTATGNGRRAARPFDINGAGFLEMREALTRAVTTGPRHVTVVLHSFSFIKHYDVQYRKVRPRWNVIRRFERLCRFLAENPSGFRVRTFGELHREALEEAAKNARHEWPRVPAPATWVRLAEQAMDRWL